MKSIDEVGNKYGLLTVKSRSNKKTNSGNTHWNCLCECGKETISEGYSLRTKKITSCGCIKIHHFIKMNTTHGKSKTIEYNTWCLIKGRCLNKNNPKFKQWGGKGITVCKEWINDFEQFLSDMGKRPDGCTSIDRRDNTKGYSKENCRWATATMQARNSSHTNLTENLVAEIRATKNISSRKLAIKYGVGKSTILRIKNNQVWV